MSEMVAGGSKYTDEQRREAAVQYAISGNLAEVERQTGIPDSTVHTWLNSDWFIGTVGEVRSQNQDLHIARYHELISEATEQALRGVRELSEDKLSPGDIKALVVTAACGTDKSRLLMNQPTSISSKSEGMEALAARFAKIEQDHANIQSSVVAVDNSVDKSE